MRGVTSGATDYTELENISTHTPHARRDFSELLFGFWFGRFQLTRLMRGVTSVILLKLPFDEVFQLTRLMRGVTCNGGCVLGYTLRFQLTRLMRGVTLHTSVLQKL